MTFIEGLKHFLGIKTPSPDLYSYQIPGKWPNVDALIPKDLTDYGWRYSYSYSMEEENGGCHPTLIVFSNKELDATIRFELRMDHEGKIFWANIQDRVFSLGNYYAIEKMKEFLDICTEKKDWVTIRKKMLEMS